MTDPNPNPNPNPDDFIRVINTSGVVWTIVDNHNKNSITHEERSDTQIETLEDNEYTTLEQEYLPVVKNDNTRHQAVKTVMFVCLMFSAVILILLFRDTCQKPVVITQHATTPPVFTVLSHAVTIVGFVNGIPFVPGTIDNVIVGLASGLFSQHMFNTNYFLRNVSVNISKNIVNCSKTIIRNANGVRQRFSQGFNFFALK